jgi:hypothetical protein
MHFVSITVLFIPGGAAPGSGDRQRRSDLILLIVVMGKKQES